MSRNTSSGISFSPVQRRACIVLVLCVLAVILTFVGAWIVPGMFSDGSPDTPGYDSTLYPIDTTLGSVLPEQAAPDSTYATSTVYVGDSYTSSLRTAGQITLDQYLGRDAYSVNNALQEYCVYFQDDANSYTVPQALAKMKPRRIVVTLGSNDITSDMSVDSLIQDYRHVLDGYATAYSYCDIIVNTIPPVNSDSENAAADQLLIDQVNQALAVMCDEAGYKLLNSASVLKDSDGFADAAYISGGAFTTEGAKKLVNYVTSHAYDTEDRRPDTDDVPKRAQSASSSAQSGSEATPTPTPTMHTVVFEIEDGKGSLNGNDKKGVTKLEFEVEDGETVTVEAVAAEGYTFFGWSDGIKNSTWSRKVTQDLSVTAMFNKKTTAVLTIDEGNQTMRVGESRTFHASLTVNDKAASTDSVQWAVNGELQKNGYSYTFTPTDTGTYTIKAGIEVDGVYASQEIKVTVEAAPTTINISGPSSIQAGNSATLSATVENQSGEVEWSCPQVPDWKATGNSVQFTAPSTIGECTIIAKNNGVSKEFKITVTAAPEPTPTPTPVPESKPDSGNSESNQSDDDHDD